METLYNTVENGLECNDNAKWHLSFNLEAGDRKSERGLLSSVTVAAAAPKVLFSFVHPWERSCASLATAKTTSTVAG